MKKNYKNLVLLILLVIFISLFKYNSLIRTSVISSCSLWFYNLVPSMLVMYLITDLLINYGFADFLYKIFKSNSPFLIGISMMLGTPANAKYIKEFYEGSYISKSEASWLLFFAYSPNPLFIIGIAPTKKLGILTLITTYLSNFLIAIFTKHKYSNTSHIIKKFNTETFSHCIDNSITKSFKILILVLGIIIVYGIINSLLEILLPNALYIKIVLEMTNALKEITTTSKYYNYMLLACTFGGFSIHTQVKSILEDTNLPYKNFLLGRLISSALSLLVIIFL